MKKDILRAVGLARGRRSDHGASASLRHDPLATLVCQLIWVGREDLRMSVSGVCWPVTSRTQRLPTFSRQMGQFGELHLRESRFGHFSMGGALNGCAGAGPTPKERAQAAWLVLATDNELASG